VSATNAMSGLIVLALDRDTAGHLAVALRRHRGHLQQIDAVEPAGLADLEALAVSVYKRQEATPGDIRRLLIDDDRHERDYLTRDDIRQRTGASLRTVDRWIASGKLASCKRGGIRRVARADLDRFLST
jgi:excisionase family DNA binding protein